MSDYEYEQPAKQDVYESRNVGYNNASVIELRLNTQPIIDQIEITLRGSITKPVQDDDGNIMFQEVKILNRPRCNVEGYQAIVNYVSVVVNSQTVQGNWKGDEMYTRYIVQVRLNLARIIMDNLHNWEIERKDYSLIVDSIMDLVEAFMTRPIDNRERDSYAATIRHSESNTMAAKSGGFLSSINPFKRG